VTGQAVTGQAVTGEAVTGRAGRRERRLALAAAALVAAAGLAVASASRAQRVAPGEPLTVVVGEPPGPAPMDRLDGRRTNASRDRLPTASLRVLWSRQTRPMTSPPVIAQDGTVIVAGSDGILDLLNPDGTTLGRLPIGPGPLSGPAVLADGTVVAVNGAGDVVGTRRRDVLFRSRALLQTLAPGGFDPSTSFAATPHGWPRKRHPPSSSSPGRVLMLPLEDGGLALALDRELVCVDARGEVRSRAFAPLAPTSPLLALARPGPGSPPAIAFVAEGGDVYEWSLSEATDAVSSHGSFGGPVEGSVVVEDGRHLLGVVRGTRLVVLDLATGVAETRTTSASGAFTDALALGHTGDAWVQEMTLTGTRLLGIDREGHTNAFVLPLTVQGLTSFMLPDAGAGASASPTGTRLFTDPTGAVAYATVDGHVGVATPTTKHEVGTLPCGAPATLTVRTRPSIGFVGLLPAGDGAFVVACEGGGVSMVKGVVE
jgi:hypothetical protein